MGARGQQFHRYLQRHPDQKGAMYLDGHFTSEGQCRIGSEIKSKKIPERLMGISILPNRAAEMPVQPELMRQK